MKTLSVKLPEPLAEWLAGEAMLKRSSRSAIVRAALDEKRRGLVNGAGGAKRRSLAEALLACGGPFRGPGDLNSNPKYFNDFGR